jgi:L,D-transpeptidase catalytic domain
MLRMLRRLIALSAVTLLAPLAVASASAMTTPTATTPATSPTSAPLPPKPQPARGSLRLHVPDGYAVHRELATIPGRVLHVVGVVRPFVPGQWVTVRAYLGHRLFKTDLMRIKPSHGYRYGRFSEALSSPGVGTVTIKVIHALTSAQAGFESQRRYSALDERIGFGSTGTFVALVQQRLAALHFYIPQSGVYDDGTALAMDAYHRLLGWGTYKTIDGRTISWLMNGWGQFKVRYPGQGRHAEGNLGNQLLALINGSRVDQIFPISSGKPSTPTILGNFNVYRRVPGIQPDGMYFSSYFIGGYAIHGYNPAPDYPASHGCMRLPMSDAIFVYDWLNFGDGVDVYY